MITYIYKIFYLFYTNWRCRIKKEILTFRDEMVPWYKHGVYLAPCCVCYWAGSWPALVQPPMFGCSCPAGGWCNQEGNALKLSWSPLLRLYREESCRTKRFRYFRVPLILLQFFRLLHILYILFGCDFICECITLVDVWRDCCDLLPPGHPGLESPCWTAAQRQTQRHATLADISLICLLKTQVGVAQINHDLPLFWGQWKACWYRTSPLGEPAPCWRHTFPQNA